jgi:hypothetical protein
MLENRIPSKSLFTAVLAAAVLVGCSESSVAPSRLLQNTPLFALGGTTTSAVETGVLKICKTGNAGGTFAVTRTLVGADVLGTIQNPITVANGECRIAALDNSGSGIAELVTVTENAAANTVETVTGCTDGAVTFSPCINLEVNVVTYNNVFTPPRVTALFVIGDVEAHGIGDNVNFWGAQWWKNNEMSGFVSHGVASFKGYATSSDNVCGGTWVSLPGNSSDPPDVIPDDVAIIVTSTVLKVGPNISGDIRQIVIVKQDGGYEGNPGHPGNGPVTSIVCTAP